MCKHIHTIIIITSSHICISFVSVKQAVYFGLVKSHRKKKNEFGEKINPFILHMRMCDTHHREQRRGNCRR